MAKTRVFVSFDYDNDLQLKEGLVGQAKLPDSPFDIADHSLKEAAPQAEWLTRARGAIAGSEVVIVMLGRNTHSASGVRKEVDAANGMQKKVFQLRPQGSNAAAVRGAGNVHTWTWPNLKVLLA